MLRYRSQQIHCHHTCQATHHRGDFLTLQCFSFTSLFTKEFFHIYFFFCFRLASFASFLHTKCVNCNSNHGWWNWIPVFISFSLNISFTLYVARENVENCSTRTNCSLHWMYCGCHLIFCFSFTARFFSTDSYQHTDMPSESLAIVIDFTGKNASLWRVREQHSQKKNHNGMQTTFVSFNVHRDWTFSKWHWIWITSIRQIKL